MKLNLAKIKEMFLLTQNFFCYVVFGGILCVSENNLAMCQVSKNGTINLFTKKEKFCLIPHKNIWGVRGLEFLFFSVLFYTKALLWSAKNNTLCIKPAQKKLFRKFLFCLIVAVCFIALLFAIFFLVGVLPSYLCFWILGEFESLFSAQLFIAILRVLILVLMFFCIKLLSSVRSVWRFNSAANKAVCGKENGALNFYNITFGALLLDVFMVSLLGLNVSGVWGVVLSVAILALSFALVFELCVWQSNSKGIWGSLYKLVGGIFCEQPSKTENQVAMGGKMECELMIKNPERELINTFEEQDDKPLAFVLAEIKERLEKGGVDSSEAEWLIALVLKKKKFDIKFIKSVPRDKIKEIMVVLERRLKFEPLDKIFGEKEFYGLSLIVNKNVLSPRFETELLVENVIKEVKEKNKNRVLDLCTGSGAIAIAVAKHTNADVFAVDISEEALVVAKKNAERCGVSVKFKQSNLFDKVTKKFDIIVSNPPYIRTEEIAHLDKEVKNFDPVISLDGGSDGLYFYRKIAADAPRFLTKNGKLFLEVGKGQANKVKKLLTENFEHIKILKDYNGIQRMVIAQKKD